jgi:spermidine synthase
MGRWPSALLTFLTAGAVLVMEIVAARLLAPYVGVTLETYTAIIGTVLAGISAGAYAGGWLADRIDPARLLGPVIIAGGALVMASLPLLRVLGDAFGDQGSVGAIFIAAGAFLPSAAVLSTVSPLMIKLNIRSVETAGSTVGLIEASGTIGAIVGTFVAGFILVGEFASDYILIGEGLALVALGVLVHLFLRKKRPQGLGAAGLSVSLALSGVGLGSTTFRTDVCEYETRYFCVNIEEDGSRASGRYLLLDTLWHSYTDLNDETYVEFEYANAVLAGVEAKYPAGPLRVITLGGGAFTIPRYFHATRPGSTNLVIERDDQLTKLDQDLLGLKLGNGLSAVAGDARVEVRKLSKGDWDVVMGDAFGGEAIPFHLATVEFARDVRDRLRPGGLYVQNVIDSPPSDGVPGKFVRAEISTLQSVFEHVAVSTSAYGWDGVSPENFVVYASNDPLPIELIKANLVKLVPDWTLREGDELQQWIGDGAFVLTDRYAPVDQLLTVD